MKPSISSRRLIFGQAFCLVLNLIVALDGLGWASWPNLAVIIIAAPFFVRDCRAWTDWNAAVEIASRCPVGELAPRVCDYLAEGRT